MTSTSRWTVRGLAAAVGLGALLAFSPLAVAEAGTPTPPAKVSPDEPTRPDKGAKSTPDHGEPTGPTGGEGTSGGTRSPGGQDGSEGKSRPSR